MYKISSLCYVSLDQVIQGATSWMAQYNRGWTVIYVNVYCYFTAPLDLFDQIGLDCQMLSVIIY